MKYHILSIGISKHQNPEANLQYASKDAADFFTLFTQNVANVGYSKLLTDNEATLSSIQTALGNELQNQVGAEDGFVLYYSGHGALAPGEGDAFTHYLVPFDVTEDIPNSSIPIEYIRGIFEKLNCRSKLFFVDSCFSGAVNSKSYGPSYKAIKNIKKLSDEISGEGSVVFTACGDDEKSIEDEKLENGVFTSFLLSELQEKKEGERFSIIDIFTPISEKTSAYTEVTYHFKQTPTFSGNLKDVLYLPVFRKPLNIKPELIDIPKTQSVVDETPLSPEVDLSVSEENDLVDESISFVLRTSDKNNLLLKIEFERFALGLGKKTTKKWEEIFECVEAKVENIPEAVSRLEVACHQLFVLAAAVGAYGNAEQVKIVSEICGELLKTTYGKSGLIAMIAVLEVAVLFIEYIFAITAQAGCDFTKLKSFVDARIYGFGYDMESPTVLSLHRIHYTSALTGHADKVGDYVRKGLATMSWLKRIHPRLDVADFDNLQLQANFILVLLHIHHGSRAYPDFGRFYSNRLLVLIERIKYDSTLSNSLAKLFDLQPKNLRTKLIQYVNRIIESGLGSGYWWNSINADDLLTMEEIKKRDEEKMQKSSNA